MMLTVDIKCRLFLQKEYFVSILFTDIKKCSWHGITIPYQINIIAYSHPTQTIVSFNQTVDCLRKSPTNNLSLSEIYENSRAYG